MLLARGVGGLVWGGGRWGGGEGLRGFLGGHELVDAGVVEDDVDVAEEGPGVVDLGGEGGEVGGDVELEEAQGGGGLEEGAETGFDVAAGGNDAVTAAEEFLDYGLADARGGAGDEPDLGGHCRWKWRGGRG